MKFDQFYKGIARLLFITVFAASTSIGATFYQCQSPTGSYVINHAESPDGFYDISIKRKKDGRKLAVILSSKDGIKIDSVDARWSPDEEYVVVLVERRHIYDLEFYKKNSDGSYKRQ